MSVSPHPVDRAPDPVPGPLPDAPELSDGVIRLRPWRRADAPALVAAWTDPVISSRLPVPADQGLDAARRWIDGWDERRRTGAALDLAITLDGSSVGRLVHPERLGRVIGEIGFSGVDSGRRAALVGWWLAQHHRGEGFATRALETVAAWVLEDWLETLVAEIDVDNERSRRLAERCRFAVIGESIEGRLIYARRVEARPASVASAISTGGVRAGRRGC